MRRLKAIGESVCFLGILLALGVLNYGWPFYPIIGSVNGWLNASIVGMIAVVGMCFRLGRKATVDDDSYADAGSTCTASAKESGRKNTG